MSGKSHPLPGSDEARHNEIPEHIALEKGRGADARKGIQPNPEAVNPDGEPYRYDDLGRGPGSSRQESRMANDRSGDRGEELPREQDQNGTSTGGRQVGGGPSAADMAAPGGSSGTGGYGKAQNQQLHQGQQGGGRGDESVSSEDDLGEDQAAHQDRGQSVAEAESEES